jgi:threonine aldolase
MGGGWRQAGYLAAAGIYALDNNISRLKEDHQRARSIGEMLKEKSYVNDIYPIDTNIVIFELNEDITSIEYVSKMSEKGLYCVPFGKQHVRFVTHLDFNDDHLSTLRYLL